MKVKFLVIVKKRLCQHHDLDFFWGPNGIHFVRCHFWVQKRLAFQLPPLPMVVLEMDLPASKSLYVLRHINNKYINSYTAHTAVHTLCTVSLSGCV